MNILEDFRYARRALRAQASRVFYVTGHVKSPGAYPHPGHLTVLQAVALAGGVTQDGSTRRIVIKRKVDGDVIEIAARLNTAVQADDVIYVLPRQ